jgi:4'-phosphopantetheinyl transferase
MLLENVVEVWLERLNPANLPELELMLTTTELAQANRCRLPHIRQRKVVARARLRQILSSYVGIAPQLIEISRGIHGKPQVLGLEFNVSHSENLAVYAISQQPVGIDIEYVRSLEMTGLVQRFFAPAELVCWQQLPEEQQQLAFFRAWTMKEAYLKAIGTGLHTPLSAVVVEMDVTKPAGFIATPDAQDWQLESLLLPKGYVGVVVMRGGGNQIVQKEQWSWP